ncbi:MAG: glycosyltransferase family 4 protein [Ornithinimicrobium sp.]
MPRPRIVVAHPSPDLYGSDRQLLVTVSALVEHGWDVVVALPVDGPLTPLLRDRGATVVVDSFPVLRKALITPRGILGLGVGLGRDAVRLRGALRRTGADAVFVNTLTIPVWLLAARLAGVPAVCHVHEAEEDQPRLVRRALAAQMFLTGSVIANSGAARRALVDVVPRLAQRITVVHNGVPAPPPSAEPPRPRRTGSPSHVSLVARLSPRKGIDVALEAVARLRQEGREVTLTVCGTAYQGYEWYEQELRDRAARPDLEGAVSFEGYVDPTWPVLNAADVVVVPSRVEPFGNTAVEALLAQRPVVASGVQGLREVIRHNETGLLVPPDDPVALAEAIAALVDDPERAGRLARSGAEDAHDRFSEERYRTQIGTLVDAVRPT